MTSPIDPGSVPDDLLAKQLMSLQMGWFGKSIPEFTELAIDLFTQYARQERLDELERIKSLDNGNVQLANLALKIGVHVDDRIVELKAAVENKDAE